MDLLYSMSLLLALVAGAVGILLGALVVLGGAHDRLPQANPGARRASLRAALAAVVVGALSLIISVAIHRRWGHGPASAAPMDVAGFLSAHKAFLLAAVVIVAGWVVVVYARKRRRDGRA